MSLLIFILTPCLSLFLTLKRISLPHTSYPKHLAHENQVNGYAKKFAGSVFGNKGEKEFGEKKLDGEI